MIYGDLPIVGTSDIAGTHPISWMLFHDTARNNGRQCFPLRRGVKIVRGAHQRLSGLEKTSRYVVSHETGKTEILGIGQDNRLAMRYHQATDPQQTGLLFSRAISENACWLDDLPEGRRE